MRSSHQATRTTTRLTSSMKRRKNVYSIQCLARKSALFRKCAPRPGQKHFLTAGNAPELPAKSPRLAFLYALFGKSKGLFNWTCIALITTVCKIINSTAGFLSFLEICCVEALSHYTACLLRPETLLKHHFSKKSPALEPQRLFHPYLVLRNYLLEAPSKAPLGHITPHFWSTYDD